MVHCIFTGVAGFTLPINDRFRLSILMTSCLNKSSLKVHAITKAGKGHTKKNKISFSLLRETFS